MTVHVHKSFAEWTMHFKWWKSVLFQSAIIKSRLFAVPNICVQWSLAHSSPAFGYNGRNVLIFNWLHQTIQIIYYAAHRKFSKYKRRFLATNDFLSRLCLSFSPPFSLILTLEQFAFVLASLLSITPIKYFSDPLWKFDNHLKWCSLEP